MVLIDLGEPSRYEPGPPPPPRAHSLLARSRRVLAAAGVVIAAAGFVAGSPPPAYARPHLNIIGRVTGPLAPVVGDLVINSDQDGNRLVAYALDGRGVRWTVAGGGAPNSIARRGDHTLIVIFSDGSSEPGGVSVTPASVAALDLATGRVLWRRPGYAQTGADGPVMLLSSAPKPDVPLTVSGVSTADGRVLWTRTLPPLTQLVAETTDSGPPSRAVLLGPTGEVQLLSLADGLLTPVGQAGPGAALFAWHDLLLLRETSPTGLIDLAAYSVSERRIAWRLPGDHALWPCDGLICQTDSGTFTKLDPVTGQTLTSGPDQPFDPFVDFADVDLTGWEAVGAYRGGMLVRLDPAHAADHQAWLGYASTGPGGRAHTLLPLMPIGGRANSCHVTEEWFYCDGSVVVDAVSVRLSDLDPLIGGRAAG